LKIEDFKLKKDWSKFLKNLEHCAPIKEEGASGAIGA